MWNERNITVTVLAACFLASSMSLNASSTKAATVYKSVDSEGRVTYSDQPPVDSEDVVEVLDFELRERSAEEIEGDMARIEAMRETTDRMAADRREREAARAKARAEAEAARAASYQQQYPDYYYDDSYRYGAPYYGGSVVTRSRYSRSRWGVGINIGSGHPHPPYVRPPHHRPPHVRPPYRPGHPRAGRQNVAEPGFSYNAPANQIRRRYTGKAREVFYGR